MVYGSFILELSISISFSTAPLFRTAEPTFKDGRPNEDKKGSN